MSVWVENERLLTRQVAFVLEDIGDSYAERAHEAIDKRDLINANVFRQKSDAARWAAHTLHSLAETHKTLQNLWAQAEGCPHCCNTEEVDEAFETLTSISRDPKRNFEGAHRPGSPSYAQQAHKEPPSLPIRKIREKAEEAYSTWGWNAQGGAKKPQFLDDTLTLLDEVERLKELERACEEIDNTVNYVLATIGRGGRMKDRGDEDWVKIHRGRATSSVRQLENLKRKITQALQETEHKEMTDGR